MKEFDLEAAKAGKKVQLRSGREARIICFNRKDPVMPIVVLIKDDEGVENVHYYAINGKRAAEQPYLDLVMASEKMEGYVNIFKSPSMRYFGQSVFETEDEAKHSAALHVDRNIIHLATIKVEWEE